MSDGDGFGIGILLGMIVGGIVGTLGDGRVNVEDMVASTVACESFGGISSMDYGLTRVNAYCKNGVKLELKFSNAQD